MTIVLNTKGTILRLQLPLITPPVENGLALEGCVAGSHVPFYFFLCKRYQYSNKQTDNQGSGNGSGLCLLGLADDCQMTQLSDETTVR